MAHLDPNFSSFATFLEGADAFYSGELVALNSSGVTGTVIAALSREEDGTGYLNVSVVADGLTAGEAHAQHIHGRFGEDGQPIDSVSPTILQDADDDGIVEVLEGLSEYGDILLPLDDDSGIFPIAGEDGTITFFQSYAIEDDSNFFSPVTGTDYEFDDLTPLALREYVIHGVLVPDGIGAGTDGEVDGGENGYIPILPAASDELSEISREEALALLQRQESDASTERTFFGDDDLFFAGAGSDTVVAGAGDDTIYGGDGNDDLDGLAGNDDLFGGEGSDNLNGGSGDDGLFGGENDDVIRGGNGDDTIDGENGDDALIGGAGHDMIQGGSGDDDISGSAGNDRIEAGSGDDFAIGQGGADTIDGGAGADEIFGVSGNDKLFGGAGDDVIGGGAGEDALYGGDGGDFMSGADGDDLVLGGRGTDILFGGNGLDILGGGAGNDRLTGGNEADEFHFNSASGSDIVRDFTQGEDVISFQDGGAIEFENSEEDAERGDSDLAADDFDFISSYDELDASNGGDVVYSTGGADELMTATGGVDITAYIAATSGSDTKIFFDDDWSSAEGRELIATLEDFSTAMSASDFDVY